MNDHLTKLTRNIGMKFRPNFGGTANGLLFFCLSFTPSLLPRGYVVQGVASGLSFVTGYAIGVLLSSLYHAVPRFRSWIMPATAKHIIIWFLLVLSVVFIALGIHWQSEIRKITQAAPTSASYPIRVVIIFHMAGSTHPDSS
jgi:uncharacterized membrane protein